MILAIFFYGIIIKNDPELKIPFGPGDEYTLEPQFGWSFYLTLFTGLGCVVLGCLIWALDFFVPRKIAIVFNQIFVEDDEFFREEVLESEQLVLEEYGMPIRSVRKTPRGLSRYRQTQRKSRSATLPSQGASRRYRNDPAIPMEQLRHVSVS